MGLESEELVDAWMSSDDLTSVEGWSGFFLEFCYPLWIMLWVFPNPLGSFCQASSALIFSSEKLTVRGTYLCYTMLYHPQWKKHWAVCALCSNNKHLCHKVHVGWTDPGLGLFSQSSTGLLCKRCMNAYKHAAAPKRPGSTVKEDLKGTRYK